tara:strand:- start:482 stop:2338 length:1857 start_codon:yes stop_codon:yes gene_type:complete
MANYTTTKFKATETIGDSIFNNNMITEASINIVPNQGYVVTASDFSLPVLPNGISAVVFTDTKIAGQPGNEVKVTATFADTFVVTKRNKIHLYFAGDAKTWDPEAVINVDTSIVLIDDKNNNKNGSVAITTETGYTINTITNVGINGDLDIINNTITGSIVRSVPTKIAEITITADDGYYFSKKPSLNLYDNSFVNTKLRLSSISRDSNNKITGYTFSLLYNNNYNIDTTSPLEMSLLYNAILIPTTTKEVTTIVCGDSITERGDIKNIKIYGNEGAEFDVTITKGTDPTSSILNNSSSALNKNAPDNRLQTVEINTPWGVVKGLHKKIITRGRRKRGAIGYCNIIQEFPASNEIIRTTTAHGGGISGTDATFASIADVKVGDRLFMDAIPTNTVVKVASLTSGVRCQLDTSVTAAGSAAAVFRRQESYDINIYPRAGTTLGSRIPIQKPHYTITQYKNPVLKLTATTTNSKITAPADVSVTGRPNTLSSRLRESLTVTAASGTSVVAYHKAGKDRGRRDFFRLTYTVASTHAVSKTKDPSFVNENKYDNYGALTSSSDWTNSIASENGGTRIIIGSVVSSIASSPSHVYTLSFDVLIEKFGTEDTTMVLDLDNLISA